MFKKIIKPKNLFLNLSTNCNLNCQVCYGHLDICEPKNMSLETAKEATELYYKNRDFFHKGHYIMFFGGEPLINFSIIPDYISWFKNKYKDFNCSLFIFTNGILLDKAKIDFFLRNKIGIFISYGKSITNESLNNDCQVNYHKHIQEIIKYSVIKNPELIIPYYIIKNNGLNELNLLYEEMNVLGVKNIAITRKLFEKWDDTDINSVYEASVYAKKKYGFSILIYPDMLRSCKSNCIPNNIMVYPNGDVYDLCLVALCSLIENRFVKSKSIKTLFMGNINKISCFKININKKKSIMQKKYSGEINTSCPTLDKDYEKIKFLRG